MSQNRDQQYLCDGLTEELISALAGVRGLRVVSRTSSFSFRDTNEDIRTIGRKLSVGAVLEGSIRKAGNRIRITAQLIESESGYHMWTAKYDRDMEDIFAIQEDVTKSIVSALGRELLHDKGVEGKAQTTNMEAYNEYLLGLEHWNKRTDEGLLKSLDHFTRAATLDPNYTAAHCGIADAYNVMAGYCVIHPRTGLERSLLAIQTALRLNSESAEALGLLATNHWELRQAAAEAEEAFKRALALNANSTRTMNSYIEMLMVLARFDEASLLIDKVIAVDPLGWVGRLQQSYLALFRADYVIALAIPDEILETRPGFLPALRHKCHALAAKGDLDSAIAIAEECRKIAGEHPMYVSMLGYVTGLSGDRGRALDCLDRLRALEEKRFVPSYERAMIYLGMKDYENTLAELDRGIEECYCRQLEINVDPVFYPLRGLPKFEELVRRLNLVR
jgi:TolB-like protein